MSAKVNFERMLDLTDSGVLTDLGVEPQSLVFDPKEPKKAMMTLGILGTLAKENRIDAVIYPSNIDPSGQNLFIVDVETTLAPRKII